MIVAVTWIAAEATLAIEDRSNALVAVGFLAYLMLLWVATTRIVRPRVSPSDVFLARAPQITLAPRLVVVGSAFLLVTAFVFDRSGVTTFGLLSHFFLGLLRALPWFGHSLANFVLYALVPGAIILGLGVNARQLGIARPASRSFIVGPAWIALFVASWFYRLAIGAVSLPWFFGELVRNFFSNGVSEEFLFRGLIMSHLRAVVSTEWALLFSSLGFALFHLGSSMRDEPNLIGIFANVIALNVPFGWVMGLVALRTRSLAVPTVIHVSLDMTRHVWA